jgi:membrane fusion protein, heavy metal efflux system
MKQVLAAAFWLAVCCACNQQAKKDQHAHLPDGSHPGEQGLPSLSYTLYSDKSELFVEFKPLVVGKTSKFATHLTKLGEHFVPYTEGSVTVSLIVNNKGIRQTADSPASTGIFRLALQPEASGSGKLVFDIHTKDFNDQFILDSIMVYPDEATALKAQAEASPGSNEVSYLKEQAWKIDFANAPVHRTSFYNVIRTSGQITAATGDEQTLTARTSGVIRILKQGIYAGSAVHAGQSLFSISSKGFTGNNANVQLQEAANNLSKAKADFERNKDLYKDRLITQQQYLQSQNEYENAAALHRSLSSNYNESKGQTVSVGRSGFIRSLQVTEGQFVEAGQPLATITANKQVAIRADVPQSAFARLGAIRSANFKIDQQQVYSLEQLNGKLISTGKAADNSMFIPVFFSIDNKEGLMPGTFIEVFLKTGSIVEALVIPLSAVMEEQGNYYCYVQTAGETFEKRQITLGGNDGQQVQVLSGIQESERVVTKGAYNIKLSTASGTLPAHGHEH